MSLEFVVLRMLKLLALERMRRKRTVIEDLKIIRVILEARKSSEYKKNFEKKRERKRKKKKKKKKKEKERNKVVIQGKKECA